MADFYKNIGREEIELPSGKIFPRGFHFRKDCPEDQGVQLSAEDQTFLDDLVSNGEGIALVEIPTEAS